MSQAYQTGVAESCRNAQVVFDKFHVIKNANEAVDKVRRAEVGWAVQGCGKLSIRVNGFGAKPRRT